MIYSLPVIAVVLLLIASWMVRDVRWPMIPPSELEYRGKMAAGEGTVNKNVPNEQKRKEV